MKKKLRISNPKLRKRIISTRAISKSNASTEELIDLYLELFDRQEPDYNDGLMKINMHLN